MYTPKDFSQLLGLDGLSDALLNNHFTLYQGYVTNTNKLLEKFDKNEVVVGTPEFSEFQRRFGWEWNGMRMHELYFGNMSKENNMPSEDLEIVKALSEKYGSFENFKNNFIKNVGMFRGIGWVALVKRDDTLGVIWIGEHDEGLLANSQILLIMDCWEHAYMTDYGIKRADYINNFINVIDWQAVENRYNK